MDGQNPYKSPKQGTGMPPPLLGERPRCAERFYIWSFLGTIPLILLVLAALNPFLVERLGQSLISEWRVTWLLFGWAMIGSGGSCVAFALADSAKRLTLALPISLYVGVLLCMLPWAMRMVMRHWL